MVTWSSHSPGLPTWCPHSLVFRSSPTIPSFSPSPPACNSSIYAFKHFSNLVGGTYDGIPPTLLDPYPELKALHNRVAVLPTVAKRYENVTEGARLAYKPQ